MNPTVSVSPPLRLFSVTDASLSRSHFWCEAEVSQRLLEASHCNDLKSTLDCISDRFVDVCRNELANEVRVEYEEFKTDVMVFFLAIHAGTVTFIKKLLVKFFVSLGGPHACGEGIVQCRKGGMAYYDYPNFAEKEQGIKRSGRGLQCPCPSSLGP
ncbi:hypothetical protein CsSME_00053849 [Camellia sinensis var. sinensis]